MASEKSKQSKRETRGGPRKGAGRPPKHFVKLEPIADIPQKQKLAPEDRTDRGTFKTGVSGNPGGQPKGHGDVRVLARTYTRRAVERMAEWMESDNAKASVAACVGLLNRGWGMPQQNVKATVTHLRNMTDDELLGFLTGGDDEGGRGTGDFAPSPGEGKPN